MMPRFYITKFALTNNVYAIEAEVPSDDTPDMIVDNAQRRTGYYHGNDWHWTPEAALARAEEMRAKKLASLRKSIAKMEALKFSVPT